jgi:predicted RNA binding protein YcfA (HicA-like mRNA interferase family)
MKSSELIRFLQSDGWLIERQAGSHVIMKHPSKDGSLSIPFHGSAEVKKGLLQAILKKANLKRQKDEKAFN